MHIDLLIEHHADILGGTLLDIMSIHQLSIPHF